MDEKEVVAIFDRYRAIIRDTHIVLTEGRHSDTYIEKARVFPYIAEIFRFCRAIAEHFWDGEIETVIGPATGGITLSGLVALHLMKMNNEGREVLAVHADKAREKQADGSFKNIITIRPPYHGLISGRRILAVDDTLTTGGSTREMIESVRTIGGHIIGLGVLWNRGNVTCEAVGGVPELFALVNEWLPTWSAEECLRRGPCSRGVPVNPEVGKGKELKI